MKFKYLALGLAFVGSAAFAQTAATTTGTTGQEEAIQAGAQTQPHVNQPGTTSKELNQQHHHHGHHHHDRVNNAGVDTTSGQASTNDLRHTGPEGSTGGDHKAGNDGKIVDGAKTNAHTETGDDFKK